MNGWQVVDPARQVPGSLDGSYLHRWDLELDRDGDAERALTVRRGSAGFLLCHLALWFDNHVERLDEGVWDEWGHAIRPVRGQTSGYSNHAAGTAIDLNATRHPFHVATSATFTPKQVAAIRARLGLYSGTIDWGGDWRPGNQDGMHFEIAPGTTMGKCETVARRLLDTARGRRLLSLNKDQRAVILS